MLLRLVSRGMVPPFSRLRAVRMLTDLRIPCYDWLHAQRASIREMLIFLLQCRKRASKCRRRVALAFLQEDQEEYIDTPKQSGQHLDCDWGMVMLDTGEEKTTWRKGCLLGCGVAVLCRQGGLLRGSDAHNAGGGSRGCYIADGPWANSTVHTQRINLFPRSKVILCRPKRCAILGEEV